MPLQSRSSAQHNTYIHMSRTSLSGMHSTSDAVSERHCTFVLQARGQAQMVEACRRLAKHGTQRRGLGLSSSRERAGEQRGSKGHLGTAFYSAGEENTSIVLVGQLHSCLPQTHALRNALQPSS